MVNEVIIFIEGAGNDKVNNRALRQGFNRFLNTLVEKARARRIRWKINPSGSRENTFQEFKRAIETHTDAFNVLLVDSEGPVRSPTTRKEHLRRRDGWDLSDVDEEQCHLMVQSMEAWLIVDLETVRRYYGQKFLANRLPKHSNIEEVDHRELLRKLEAATKQTQKGQYNKTRHGFELLGMVNSDVIRATCPHCNILFEVLGEKITSS